MANEEWVNPNDPEAEITRLKDGRTALAYKAENAVDMATGAIVAVTTHAGATGDPDSIQQTLPAAGEAVGEQIAECTPEGAFRLSVAICRSRRSRGDRLSSGSSARRMGAAEAAGTPGARGALGALGARGAGGVAGTPWTPGVPRSSRTSRTSGPGMAMV